MIGTDLVFAGHFDGASVDGRLSHGRIAILDMVAQQGSQKLQELCLGRETGFISFCSEENSCPLGEDHGRAIHLRIEVR